MATRKVTHPDKVYIQINDESPETLGFSFNDDAENPVGIDPNVFDQETLFRVTRMLANVFMLVEKLRTEGKEIPMIK